MKQYLSELSRHIAECWNQFWFSPTDVRTICVLRFLVGGFALYYVISQTADLTAWFAGNGMLTNQTIANLRPEYIGVSYLSYLRTPAELWIAHGLAIAILICFVVGFWTRLSGFLSLIIVVSYAVRGPILTGPFEPVLTFLIGYLCLTPAGAFFSLDHRIARQRGRSLPPTRSWSATPGLRLIQIHLAAMYLFSGLTKLGGPYGNDFYDAAWWRGEAVGWLISRTESRLIDLSFLHNVPDVLNVWTHAIVALELCFAVLIWNRWARPLLLVASTLMWIGTGLITGLVSFAALMIVAQFAFIPGETMANVVQSLRKPAIEPPKTTAD